MDAVSQRLEMNEEQAKGGEVTAGVVSFSQPDSDDGRLVSNLNANSGRWCPDHSSQEEEHHQMFIRKVISVRSKSLNLTASDKDAL